MRTLCGLLVFLGCQCVFADIGVLSEVHGDVQLLRAGEEFAAEVGVDVRQQDIIVTSADGAAQLDMEDGSVFRLGAGTRLELAQYRLSSDRGVVAAGVKLVAGWLRFAVAKLKPQATYRLQAPTLTLGIRGTEGVLEVGAEESALAMAEGEVAVVASDAPDAAAAPQRVRANEYIARRYGARLAPATAVPAAFWHRAPAHLRAKAARRAHLLPRRGVVPKSMRDRRPHVQRRAPTQAPQAGAAQQQRQHRQQQRREDRQQTREQRPRRPESERRGARE